MQNPKFKRFTYKKCGVDIDKANRFIDAIKDRANRIGSFAGLFGLSLKRFKEPVLVSSTDGVGTKLMIAHACNKHNTIGIDLVAMSANDVATTGARPLFFLDYIATGKIRPDVLKDVVSGIQTACKETGYALVGGETAEMPGMYPVNVYDIAGFCVGIVEKCEIIDGRNIKKGDVVLGIASSGLHSNGFSLVRKVFTKQEQKNLSPQLLKPTRLYTKPLLSLGQRVGIKGIAHITGGAFRDKIPRIIPKGLAATIYKKAWPIPDIFKIIQRKARIDDAEMYKVFNMGIGMAVVLAAKDIEKARRFLNIFKMESWTIGEVVKGNRKVTLV